MTYSIVARDAETGELGVAVQSHWFSVGPLVPWGKAGVGVVATQAMVDPAYGPLGLKLMRAGKSAPDTLRGLLAADGSARVRQVAMIDAAGRVAAHTGEGCIESAGQVVGEGFSVQANMMRSDAIWPAMAEAYRAAKGDLAERLVAALEGAEGAGGDLRGRQSAALLVVAPQASGRPWLDRRFELRIEDHTDPLVELRRLLRLARAYRHMNDGDAALERGDAPGALAEYGAAAELAPEKPEVRFWHGVALVGMDRAADGQAMIDACIALDDRWRVLLERARKAGLAR